MQGLFLKRQQEAAVVIAENSHRFFLQQPLLWDEILHGTYRARWAALLRATTDRFMRERASRATLDRLAAAVLVGEERLQQIVQVVRAYERGPARPGGARIGGIRPGRDPTGSSHDCSCAY